eukprot:CAMPEP_0180628534 /NCGR_PEP_ID=MMETSP1037_2-20121125/38983_1 /TAXON_ID=632150 /ORGANISM="Azadinium spinosum, Strain 3D9" /LENGTH=114 /DNA_ID=CAMNT_0022649283 /DNA_START=452 /DNA_END=797 /DNA_ORIENTATION=+
MRGNQRLTGLLPCLLVALERLHLLQLQQAAAALSQTAEPSWHSGESKPGAGAATGVGCRRGESQQGARITAGAATGVASRRAFTGAGSTGAATGVDATGAAAVAAALRVGPGKV